MTRQITFTEAVREAMTLEMRRDDTVFIAGEDIGVLGGAFGVTQGMIDEFGPGRVKNTPISETAITGIGVGAAAAGYRPCIEIMFADFMGIAMDEIANQAAKMRYMFGGKAKVPMVLRTAFGAGVRGAGHHSQSLEAWVSHIPGLKVVIPSNPYDAKGLLISSIREDNPVIFFEHKMLYAMKGDVPEGDYTVPLSESKVLKEGSDVTVISWAWMLNKSLNAAKKLSGVDVEVIDVRTLVPLDKETIISSVKKTGKVVIVQEDYRNVGFAAEIAAMLSDEAFSHLKAPIKRVTPPDTTIPFSQVLEDYYLPDEDEIIEAIKSIA